jgi:hypothetical protein
MTRCPRELLFERLMVERGIRCERPEIHGGRVDFYLPDYDLAVEIKGGWTDRLKDQISGYDDVLVLIGFDAVRKFAALFDRPGAK